MQRLALVLMLVILPTAACGGKSSVGPASPAGTTQPAVDETPVTVDALLAFMKARFPAQVADGSLTLDFGSAGVDVQVIDELAIMGITTIGQLDRATPADFDTKGFGAIKASGSPSSTVAGVLRDLMIIHDAKRYVEQAWRDSWVSSGPEDFPAPIAYGVDMAILEAGGVFGGGGAGYDEDYDDGDPCADGSGD